MLKTARKYGVRVDPHEPTENLKAEMPLWHHVGWNKNRRRRDNGTRAKCLRSIHEIYTVADAMEFSQREHKKDRRAQTNTPNPEEPSTDEDSGDETCCEMCHIEAMKGCKDMRKCQAECTKILGGLRPLWRPSLQNHPDSEDPEIDNLGRQNTYDRARTESMTQMFRVFTTGTPEPTYAGAKRRGHPQRARKTVVYTDGSCTNPGYEEAKAGAGVWYGQNDSRNVAMQMPEGLPQTNNAAEALPVLIAVQKTPSRDDLTIKTD
ncbi:hypothetical protein FA13DRAFT_1571736, partial [Coprinellus micaceus]